MIKRLYFFLAFVLSSLIGISPFSVAQDVTETPDSSLTITPVSIVSTEPDASPTLEATIPIAEVTTESSEAAPSPTIPVAETSPEPTIAVLPPEPALVPIISEAFHAPDLTRWTVGAGWELVTQEAGYALRSSTSDSAVSSNQGLWSNVAVEILIQSTGSDFELILRQTADNSYRLYLPPSGKLNVSRGTTLLAEASVSPQNPNSWRHVRFSIMGNVIRVAVDGIEVLAFQDDTPHLTAGQVAFLSRFPNRGNNTGQQNSVLVDNIRIWIPESELPPTIAPTSTPLPSITPIPTLAATFTPIPSITPIPTLEPSATPIPTETATLTPEPSATTEVIATKELEITEEATEEAQITAVAVLPTAMPDIEEDEIIIIPPIENDITFETLTLLSGCDYEVDPLIGASDISAKITDANDDGVPVTICIPEATYTFTTGSYSSSGNNAMPVITGQITLLGLDNGAVIERSTAVGIPNFRFLKVAVGASLTLENLTFQNGIMSGTGTEGSGGVVYNLGTLSTINATFTNNSANDDGGAIKNETNATLTIVTSTFEDNSAGNDGGAIDNNASMEINASTFDNNETLSISGGAIHNQTSGTVIIEDTDFTNNTANNNGGAIDNHGVMTISDGSFFQNNSVTSGTGTGQGGAIHNHNLLTVSDTVFNTNHAEDGGAIHSTTSSETYLNLTTFTGNTAIDDGGAIFNTASVIMDVSSSDFENNSAGDDGGALYNSGDSSVIDSTFITNTATNEGGAVYNTGVLDVSDSTFDGNIVNVDDGGAIDNRGTATVTNSTFTNNQVGNDGGALWNNSNATLSVIGSTFTNNSAIEGGAIHNFGYMTISVGTSATYFNQNTANDGGAIYNDTTGTSSTLVTITDAIIDTNQAVTGDGGGIKTHTPLTLNNVDIINNTAADNAGGIYAWGTSLTITNGSLIDDNSSANLGGGVYADGANNDFEMSDSQITNNTAINGGGIYGDGVIDIVDSVISSNVASNSGGGINSGATLTITNTTLSLNQATTNDGGAIYNEGSAILDNAILSDNTAGDKGGAIYTSSTLTLTGASIQNNAAVNDGGGVYNTGTLTSNTSTIFVANSTPDDGGAIYSTNKIYVTDTIFQFNTATDQGGAVLNAAGSTNTALSYVNTSCIFGNTAGNTSGVYSSTSNFNAMNNWWGAVDGPSGSGPGSGDAVNGNVLYSGFTTTSACTLSGAYNSPEIDATSANAVYTEGDDPVLVLSAISITDADSPQMSWATVKIDNYATLTEAEHDRLSVTESGGITASYNNLTGVLTLSNAADIADYVAVLETLTFATISQNPDETTRTLEIAVHDGTNTATVSITVGVVAVNDIPFIHLKTANAVYVEDGAAVTVLDSIELSDAEGTSVEQVTITITNLLDGTNEALDVSLGSTTIQKSYTDGVLTLSGVADAADYATVLATLTYANASQNLHTDNRILDFAFTFADTTVVHESLAVRVEAVADAPELDLDVSNGSSVDFATNYTQGFGWTTIVGTEVAITDIDSLNLSRVIITLTNHPDDVGELLQVDTQATGIISQYSNYVLTLSGDYPLATYATVLETLQYNNTAGEPTTGARTVIIVADDGEVQSNAATSTVTVMSDNSAPIVSLDADNSGGASPNYTQAIFYAESLVGVTITDDVDITDYDDTDLESATITMTELNAGYETLAVDISASPTLDATYEGGTLSIQGIATVAEYEAVLASLTYHNAAAVLTGSNRVVSIAVSDGNAPSAAVFATVQLEPEPRPTDHCTNWHMTQGDWIDATGQSFINWNFTYGMYGSSGTYTARVSADLAESGKTWLVYITSSDTTYSLYNVTVSGDVLIAPQTSDQTDDDPLTYGNAYVVAGDSIALEWAVDTYNEETETLRFLSICYTEISHKDLVVSSLDTTEILIDPDTLAIAGTFTANIANTGTGDIAETFEIIFFEDLNNNDTYEADIDRLLAQTEQAGLQAGQIVTITADASGEVRFVGNQVHVWVDSSEVVHEINETNNIFWAVCNPA